MRFEGRLRSAWPAAAFGLTALTGCVFAFIGLASSSYWIDELFTLFVVDHHAGLGEVIARTLTDTHPPAYYLLLYGWTEVFGLSETAERLLSALLAVGAVAVFYLGIQGAFSRAARAFACAVAATSFFWFFQAQNVRNYALSLFLSAVLLALARLVRRRAETGPGPAAVPLLALFAVGAVGAFTHFYVFVEVGLAYLVLLVTVKRRPLQLAILAGGAATALLMVAYIAVLLHHTQQNIQDMWFKNTPLFLLNQLAVAYKNTVGYLGVLAAALLIGAAWSRRAGPAATVSPDANWIAGYAAVVHLGMVVVGIAASVLLAPSFSNMNIATASPVLWALAAWLYDLGAPRLETGKGQFVALTLVVCTGAHLVAELPGRFLSRNEDWRASARYVQSRPGCATAILPVVLPFKFGGSSPFFRRLAQQELFGRYMPNPDRLRAYRPDELEGLTFAPGLLAMLAERARDRAACPVLAWGAHDLTPAGAEALRDGLQRVAGVAPRQVVLRTFRHFEQREFGFKAKPSAYVFELAP